VEEKRVEDPWNTQERECGFKVAAGIWCSCLLFKDYCWAGAQALSLVQRATMITLATECVFGRLPGAEHAIIGLAGLLFPYRDDSPGSITAKFSPELWRA
jgi:hypothetical protein